MEKIKNELSKITVEEKIEECIENVNKCFETSINIRKTEYPILMKEFDYLLENYKTSKQYKKILHEITNIQKEINKKFNNEERKIIEKLQDLLDGLYTQQAEEAFIAGYCLKIEMEKETKYNNSEKLSQEDFKALIESALNGKPTKRSLELVKDTEMYKALYKEKQSE